METEGELQEYINVLFKHWKLVLGITAITVTMAAAFALLRPPLYEAKVTFEIIKPRYYLEFEPRFRSVEVSEIPYQVYTALLKDPRLEKRVLDALGKTTTYSDLSIKTLDGMATISFGSEPSIFYLKVRSNDAKEAAQIANIWAELYVQRVREIYGLPGEENHVYELLEAAERNLESKEGALKEFRQKTGLDLLESAYPGGAPSAGQTRPMDIHGQFGILGKTLEIKLQTLADYQSARDGIRLMLQEAEKLQEAVSRDKMSPSIAIYSLMMDFFSTGIMNSRADIALSGSQIGGQSPQDLETFIAALQIKETALSTAMEQLSEEILQLQGELAEKRQELDHLRRERDIAEEVYIILARKAEESKIAAQAEGERVRIASLAVEPSKPVDRRRGIKVSVAGILGLVIGVLGAFLMERLGKIREMQRPGV